MVQVIVTGFQRREDVDKFLETIPSGLTAQVEIVSEDLFDGIVELSDDSVKKLLSEVNHDQFTVALRGASGDVERKVLSNLSEMARNALKEDVEALGPLSILQIREAQKCISHLISEMRERGEI